MLPEKQETDAGEIVEVAFQDFKPGPCKDYMCHPTVKAFLGKTSLDPLASDKRKRVDYRGSSASNFELSTALTWFGRGTIICSDPSNVEAIFRSENVAHRQAATLRSADVITLACAGPRAPETAASSTVQVEVLLHSSTHIRRTTLEAWLDPARNPKIEKFEWSAIQTGKGYPYSRDPTVQKFLEGSALDPPVAGKRLRIDLAGPSGHSCLLLPVSLLRPSPPPPP